VAGCLKSSIASELPIEFMAFDGRHHVFVCDKDAGFKQAIPLIRHLLLIAVGHWSTWSNEAFLSRDKLGADRLFLPRIILALAKWQRHRPIISDDLQTRKRCIACPLTWNPTAALLSPMFFHYTYHFTKTLKIYSLTLTRITL